MIRFSTEFDTAGRLLCARFDMQLSPYLDELRRQIDRLDHAAAEERQKARAAIKHALAMLRLERERDKWMFREWRKFNAWVNAYNARAFPGLAKLTR
jgi:hypothetical protein